MLYNTKIKINECNFLSRLQRVYAVTKQAQCRLYTNWWLFCIVITSWVLTGFEYICATSVKTKKQVVLCQK